MKHHLTHKQQRGFTLIELLVVIAIIGVLSAVVLASLSTARSKGNDAAIQANLSTVQVQAEIFYGTSNTYGTAVATGSCAPNAGTLYEDANIRKAISAAESANGSANNMVCNTGAGGASYAVASPLVAEPTSFWCIDSTGFAGKRTTALAAGASACPAS